MRCHIKNLWLFPSSLDGAGDKDWKHVPMYELKLNTLPNHLL